jgi:hypothetical protein
MMSKVPASERRVNIFVRIYAFLFLILGVSIASLASGTPLDPPVAYVFLIIAMLMVISGALALIVKLE